MRRDEFVKADDLYWASVSSAADELTVTSLNAEQVKQDARRYEAAKRRAKQLCWVSAFGCYSVPCAARGSDEKETTEWYRLAFTVLVVIA